MLKKSYIHRAFASLCIAAMLCGNLTVFAAITDLNGEIEGDEVYPIMVETRDGLQKGDEFKAPGNPYLPLWEYIPDGEPYVFEDPDNPGEYRVYVYGSHDMRIREYCGDDQVVWSANVNDLTTWRYDGKIFESIVDGSPDLLYAPDVQETEENGKKVYYLYTDNQDSNRLSMVCKSERPDGPFKVVNWKPGTNKTETVGPLHFDPGVLIEKDNDGVEHVYAYYGFNMNRENPGGSYFAELDPDNKATLKEGTEVENHIPRGGDVCDSRSHRPYVTSDNYVFPKDNDGPGDRSEKVDKDNTGKTVWQYNTYGPDKDPNWYKWGFFEASSIRKIGNKYVYIYSRTNQDWFGEDTGGNINQLAYGYSDNPWGPWKFGGVIVDSQGEVIPNGDGTYSRSTRGGNTHGSICKLGDDWYVFYHRNIHDYGRQAMADRLEFTDNFDANTDTDFTWNVENGVRWTDEPVSEGGKLEIARAEVTSEGFYKDGLNPFDKHSAGIACYFPLDSDGKSSRYFSANYDVGETSYADMPMKNIKNGVVMGVKYFDFREINENKKQNKNLVLNLELIPKGCDSSIDIYLRPKSAADTPVEKDENGNIISVGEGSKKVATVQLDATMPRTKTKVSVPITADSLQELDEDKYGLFFVFNSELKANICDLYTIQFEEDNADVTEQKTETIGEAAKATDIQLTNAETNRVLSSEKYNVGGNSITTEPASGEPGQKWSIIKAEDGNYYLTDWANEYVMCLWSGDISENAAISLYPNTASLDQMWKLELMKAENNKYYYRIINHKSGLALTACGSDKEYKVMQKQYAGLDSQLWEMNVINDTADEKWTHGNIVDDMRISEKTYHFNTDTINSDGTWAANEWSVTSAPQYFYVDTVDADKIESIAIRSGYELNSVEIAVYAYDNDNKPLDKNQLRSLNDTTEGLTKIGSAKTSKNGAYGYSTAVITNEAVTLTENEKGTNESGEEIDLFTLDMSASKTLDLNNISGRKALIVGITGNIGKKAYFDNIKVNYSEPVLDKTPDIQGIEGSGIMSTEANIDAASRAITLPVINGVNIKNLKPTIIIDYRAKAELTSGTWENGTITVTFGDKTAEWTVKTEICESIKKYLTAPYCVKHENVNKDQINASLGNTPQIEIAAGKTAKLVFEFDYLNAFSSAKVSYAQNGGTLNVKLSVSETLEGTPVQIASFDMPTANNYDTKVSDKKDFDANVELNGKKYLIVEITPATATAWVDYVELISSGEEIVIPTEYSVAYSDNKAIVTSPENSLADVIFAAYTDGVLQNIEIIKKKQLTVGETTVAPSDSFNDSDADTFKVMLWDSLEDMTPLCKDAIRQ